MCIGKGGEHCRWIEWIVWVVMMVSIQQHLQRWENASSVHSRGGGEAASMGIVWKRRGSCLKTPCVDVDTWAITWVDPDWAPWLRTVALLMRCCHFFECDAHGGFGRFFFNSCCRSGSTFPLSFFSKFLAAVSAFFLSALSTHSVSHWRRNLMLYCDSFLTTSSPCWCAWIGLRWAQSNLRESLIELLKQ